MRLRRYRHLCQQHHSPHPFCAMFVNRVAAAVAFAIVLMRLALFLFVYFGHNQTAFWFLQRTQMADCICVQAYIWFRDPLAQVVADEACSSAVPAFVAFAGLALLLRKKPVQGLRLQQ